METLLDDDQVSYQRSLRKFFSTQWTDDQVRADMVAEAPDRTTWQRLSAELGVAGLNIPEEHGGSGGAPAEALLVAEEMGRALYGGPYLSTVVLAANAIVLSGDAAIAGQTLPGIAAGEETAALALIENGRDRSRAPAPEATSTDEGWVVSGEARRVIGGADADHLLVEASTPAGRSLFLLTGTGGIERIATETLDPTRRMATLILDEAPAQLVGSDGQAAEIVLALKPLVSLALSAEAVGGAARCVDDTVEYAKVRQQFGRPVGSFQAVKHRCSEMQVRLDGARAGVRHAGKVLVDRDEDLDLLASVIKVFATRSYFETAADMIQLHGGIGFTWEHSAHLHFKRAKSLELLGGTHAEHRAAIADVVLASRG
ncbi:alkylation response protein AidB-like acyl-CoA dehydrogenase [Nocardioides marinisabuli]|uniref:Alkylation response protein AidB-like acyl-CoA dehydrogenase n=1 Tax=Nocardioides marinisabuli TaxID=419476 RepID=A0A7Y9F087_9ACTN|nr:acyl-CoA dehydrogenase family protein [Nocardioides marinisabuli]NYD57154.1 alkylation response protein AidB-like acyl-CoA dehydrogenase [Nocardioides marinisabuli]